MTEDSFPNATQETLDGSNFKLVKQTSSKKKKEEEARQAAIKKKLEKYKKPA